MQRPSLLELEWTSPNASSGLRKVSDMQITSKLRIER